MINLLAYLISLLIGFFTIRLILKNQPQISGMLTLCLSLGLGLGISASITFYSFFIFGKFNQTAILIINLIALLILFIANILYFSSPENDIVTENQLPEINSRFWITAFIAWGVAIITISILSHQYSFGGWDAWGLYNMKAKFLVFGSERWADFAKAHWHTQPSYPILLPLINTWIYSVFQSGIVKAASLTSIIFSATCGLLVYSGLSQFIKKWVALLASVLLMTTPSYIFWSTTQYADIVLAYFLLSSVILLTLTLKTKNHRFSLLAGLFLGLMPFAKNEGIVMLFLLIGLSIGYLFLNKDIDSNKRLKIIKFLLIGIASTGAALIIFKTFLAPNTREVLFNPLTENLKFCNFKGLATTVEFYGSELAGKKWNFIWIFIFLLGIFRPKNLIQNENKVFSIFFVLFGFVLLYVYLTTAHFDLTWRLECTASRIILYLLPSALFISFYSFWQEKS